MADEAYSNSSEHCMLVNASQSVIITGAYNGIPQTLILNVVSWVCLLALFAALRRSAWNYGRMALVRRTRAAWTGLFYRAGDADALVGAAPDCGSGSGSSDSLGADEGCCSWLPAVFRITRAQVLAKCGPDALHYLSFQRHLITLTFIVTLVSICVILPVNFQGNLQTAASTFSRTTVSNLRADSKWLWVHAFFGMSFLPISILIMRRCTGRKPPPESTTGTVMITNISRADRNEATIRAYFAHNFPHIQIIDLRLAYKINQLAELEEKKAMVTQAKIYSDTYLKKTGKAIKVKPQLCGAESDALEYYTQEEKRLTDETKRCRAMVLNEPLGIAFLTLPSHQIAEHVINQFSLHRGWVLKHAPNPADIHWENLNVEPGVWYIKAIIVNFFLFLVLFFLTTPAIVVNLINTLAAMPESYISKLSSVIYEFLPTLLLWTMAAVMPAIVGFSDKFLSHWTKSQQNYSIMTKTFSFLLLMTLILPSLGLASAEAFLTWTINHNESTTRWDCVFLPDKGAFFINYVITSGFIGTALELIRFPELFLYVWYLMLSKSKAEKSYVKKAILYEFPFGVHYAWGLAIFSITMTYSLVCPLISPFGLVYLLLKHYGDKHNLYFAYGPSDMSGVGGGRIHATAVRLVRVSVLLLLISMAALAGIRGGFDARTIVLIMSSIVTFGAFALLSPFPSCTPPPPLHEENTRFPEYVAPVLNRPVENSSPLHSALSTPDYGTTVFEPSHYVTAGPVNL